MWCAENGPYTLTKNLTLEDNPYGWDSNANVIYVDQPINTGFSWSDVSDIGQQAVRMSHAKQRLCV